MDLYGFAQGLIPFQIMIGSFIDSTEIIDNINDFFASQRLSVRIPNCVRNNIRSDGSTQYHNLTTYNLSIASNDKYGSYIKIDRTLLERGERLIYCEFDIHCKGKSLFMQFTKIFIASYNKPDAGYNVQDSKYPIVSIKKELTDMYDEYLDSKSDPDQDPDPDPDPKSTFLGTIYREETFSDQKIYRIGIKYVKSVLDNIIIFFTFDPSETLTSSQKNNILMLQYSIYSICRLYPYFDIRVYTTKMEKMHKLLADVIENTPTQILECPADFVSDVYDNCIFPPIGHARVYLVNDILKEGRNVLYMDNDTFMSGPGYFQFYNFLQFNKNAPYAWAKEQHMSTHDWTRKFKIDPYECSLKLGKNINNGILFFPNSKHSIKVANDIEGAYTRLLKDYNYHYGNDQIALNIAFYNNECEHNMLSEIHGCPFYHYYCDKNITMRYIKLRLIMIKRYLESGESIRNALEYTIFE